MFRRSYASISVALVLRAFCFPARGHSQVTVGYLSGASGTPEATLGSLVEPLVTAARRSLVFNTLTSSTPDAGFFSSINVFVFPNCGGSFQYNLGTAGRANLLSFVTN